MTEGVDEFWFYNGRQRYRFVRTAQTAEGKRFAVLSTTCPACGVEFETTQPLGGSKNLNRRCGDCHKPGLRA